MVNKRRIPLRKCIVTNEMRPKKDLIRIVRNKEGLIFVDPSGKQNGRGAYLTKDLEVINLAKKTGALNKQFKTKVNNDVYETLKSCIDEHNI